MKVKARLNFGRGLPPLKEGQVGEVDDAQAKRLIASGAAEPVDESAAKKEAAKDAGKKQAEGK